MATPRGDTPLIGILDKVFADISTAQVEAIQDRWVGGVIDRRPVWTTLIAYGLPALLLIGLALVFVLRINRRLSGEMSRRALLEDELRTSEQHYRGLVESLNAIAWEMRLDEHRFTYVSPHAERLLGYPWRTGSSPASGSAPSTPKTPSAPNTSATRKSPPGATTASTTACSPPTAASCGSATSSPSTPGRQPDHPRPDDRHHRSQDTEHALRLSQQKFASVFHNCPDVIALARRQDGRLLDVNRTFEQQTGVSAAQAIGRTATELGIWGTPTWVPASSSACRAKACTTWK